MTTVVAYGLPSSPVPPPPVGVFRIGTANGGANNASIFEVAPDATASLRSTVPVGTFPDGIAASPDGSLLAVVNSSDGTVSIISTLTETVLTTITVGSSPITPAWSRDGALVAVTNYSDNTISIIELATLSVIETVPVGTNPLGVCFSPDGTYLAVSEQSDGTISTVETAGWTIANTGSVGTTPAGLDIALDGSYIAVADTTDSNVYIVDPAALTVSQTIPVGLTPGAVAIDPAGAFVVCTNGSDGTVSVIETTGWTVTNTITVGSAPTVLDVAPDSSFVAVPNAGDDTMSIIRTADWTVASTTAVTNPQALVIFPIPPSPDEVGEYNVATANSADNTATVLDVTSDGVAHVDDTITGPTGSDVAVSPDGSLLAVTNPGDNTVTLFETTANSAIAIVDVGDTPVGVAFSNDGSLLAVTNRGDDTFSVIDVATRAVTQTIGTNDEPFGIVFAPDDSYVAVSHQAGQRVLTYETVGWTLITVAFLGSDLFAIDIASDGSYIAVAGAAVYILDPVTLDTLQTVSVGTDPLGLSIDPGLAFIAVSHSGEDNVWLINTDDWTVLTAVAVGPSPALLDVAPDSSFVAVPNSGDDTLTIIRTADWAVASTTSGVNTNPYAAVVYTPAARPDTPISTGLRGTWRWVVADLGGAVKTFLDKIATDVQIQYILDDAAVMTCNLPSDFGDVHQLTSISADNHAGGPRVDHNSRLIYGLRREEPGGGKPPWVCRFAGIITILQDQANEDEPVTHLTAHDPWMWARSLPVLNPDGTLLGQNGLTYTGKTGNHIALDLIANAYTWISTQFGPTFEWNGLTVNELPIDIVNGHRSAKAVIPEINFSQGTSVGDAWAQLCQTGTIDIVLRPVYGRPGVLCIMDLFGQAGKNRPGAVFGWDLFPRNLVGVDDLRDGTLVENYAQYFAGNAPTDAEQATDSVNDYGPYYVTKSYPAPADPASVSLVALAEVALRKRGKRTIQIDPSPDLAPDPFTRYGLGDVVAVWAGRYLPPPTSVGGEPKFGNSLRGGIRSTKLSRRIYGFQVDLADNIQETIRNLLLSDPNSSV